MPQDKVKEVYDLISDLGYFEDENDFRSYVTDPNKRKEAYALVSDAGYFEDENDFNSYFGDVKKKEQAIPFDGQQFGGKSEEPLLPLTSSTVSPLASKQPKSTIPLESTGAKSKQAPFQNVDISRPDLEIEPEGTKDEKDLYAKESPSERIGKMLNIQSMPSEKPAFMEDLRQRAEVDDKILNDPTFTLLSSEAGDKNEAKRVKLFEEKNRAIASERGYKDVKELYSDMDEYLADFLGEREKEEYIGKRGRVELLKQINQAKAIGQPTEELQKKYDEQVAQFSKAKADLIINADQDIRNLRRELEGADPEEKAEILSQIDGLEASKKDFFKPKTQDAKEIVEGEGLTEGSTDQEKVQIYAHSLMRERSDLREALGITKDRDAMIAYYVTAGGDNPYWRRLQDVEDKLESVAPVVLINETPITGTESAWSVFGKVFKENLMPEATDKGAQQEVAGNLIKGLDLAGVDVKNIQEDTYKTLDKTSKPYEDWSSKDLALMAAPTLAIMPKFIAATIATEGLGSFAAISPYWRSIKILSQRGSLGAAATEGSLLKVIQANKYGRGLLQAGFKGLEYGTQSQVETMIFAADKGEMGFVNGLVGGSLGVGAEKLTQLAGKGIAKVLTSIFGNKAPDATSKILAAAKKVYTYTKEENTKALGEVGEELGEDLGGMWMDSENGKEFFEKINESYGTPSKALKFFLSTYMMGYGIGAAGQLGSAAFSSAGKMYKNLSAKDRAIADNVISDLRQEQNNADVDAGIDLVKDSNLSEKEKAKAEKQITAQGAAVNGVIEGNLTTEQLNDVVSSLEEQTPSVKFESPEINLAVPENPYDKSLRKLGYADSDIEKMTIEQKQKIAENKIESPIVESSAKVDSIKENKKQERLAEMNAELDAEAKESEKTENEIKVEVEKNIQLSGLNEGFKGVTYNSFDPRSDVGAMNSINNNKSFITTISRNGKDYRVVGLKIKSNAQTGTSGRDNYSFASIEVTDNLPSNIDEILAKKAEENITAVYPDAKNIAFEPLITPKGQEVGGEVAKTENEKKVEELRAQEQVELAEAIPNIEEYKVDGKVDESLITDAADLKAYRDIYERYNDEITPLLEDIKESQVAPLPVEEEAKEQAVDAEKAGEAPAKEQNKRVFRAEQIAKSLGGVVVGSSTRKGSIPNDFDIYIENKIDLQSMRDTMKSLGYKYNGASPVVDTSGKPYAGENQTAFSFINDKGQKVDVFQEETKEDYRKRVTKPLTEKEEVKEQEQEVKEREVSEAEVDVVKALEKNFNPDFKNTIVDKLSKFDEQIANKKFPSALEVAEHVLPRSIFNKYKKLYELAARNNITVSNERLPAGMTAAWAYDNIQLNKDVAKYYLNDYNEFAETLNHEIIHGLISRGVRDNYALNKDLKEVMSQVLDRFDSASDEVKNIISYIQDVSKEFTERDFSSNEETGSLEELITYAFTNKEFADFLDSIPASKKINAKGKSIFQQLKNIIRDFISKKTKNATALDEINSVIGKYFDTSFNEKDIAERNEKYEWGKRFKANESVFDKYNNDPKLISEAYYKGDNTKLNKAVDELLGIKKELVKKEKKTPPQNVLDIAKEIGLSPQEVENTYKKYDGTKSIEEITIEDYNSARAAGNEQKLENSKKAFEALLKADSDSPTAKKKAAKIKEEVSKETLKEASDIMNNIDNIRQQLLDAGVIKSINCKWG
jgi:DNA-binding Lrp family transcriptional regulator